MELLKPLLDILAWTSLVVGGAFLLQVIIRAIRNAP